MKIVCVLVPLPSHLVIVKVHVSFTIYNGLHGKVGLFRWRQLSDKLKWWKPRNLLLELFQESCPLKMGEEYFWVMNLAILYH